MIALVTLLIWRALDGWQAGVYNAMTVLLIACPCALGLATPIAIWRALAELAARGLVVHGGETVEKLAAVDTVVFDKTGTITEIEPVLAELLIDPSSGLVQDDVREILARIEHGSAHPLAQAFAASTDERPARWQLRAVRLLPGAGVASEVVGRADGVALRVTLGTPSRLLATEKQQRAWRQLLGDRQRSAEPIVLLIDDRVCAAAFVTERARPDWAATSAALATAGLKLIVMTGDRAEHAEAVFSGAVAAGLSPQDKLARVAELRRRGHTVLFVGDGVNDAAAMAAADVSIAAGSGADLARAVADATWLGGRLAVLAEAHALALAAVRRIRSSFAFAVAYNIVGITLAAVGMLHPVVAAIVMTCSSLVVTWRAAGFAAGDAPNATEEAAVTSSAEAQWQT
jgi:Cu+-exporting ATPase